MKKPQYKIRVTKCVAHLFLLSLTVITYYQAIIGTDLTGQYINDPVKFVIHFSGMTGLQVLLLTLLISPLAQKFKQAWLMQTRRMFGLYVAFFACLHVFSFWLFELNFQVDLFIEELVKRPYIWLGMLALTLLLALSVTSINKIRAKMGPNWQKLHNWVYLVLVLVWVHFYWSVKATPTETLIYLAIVISLLAIRHKKLLKGLKALKRNEKIS
ncbi:sulfoxide reductase heme-binding subunit YedZ [Catenovulum sp. SM1970]|uniref:protein-methionine-sulfoxide reductase heme-binding subunit MsrQ n=1 Tax=Marinifaba aquimaris TaxID=2741323 RepID=UPI001572CEA3|nr:protein-methionine-sulfoxide reductase heme-binding subunit MsrQ [Marinifaba aquimaris]NTS76637.1 sulfoxide reductase heme-binding subunit YedZ [Marinifaba aquimaris]